MINEKTESSLKGSLEILKALGLLEVSYAVRKSTVVEVVTTRCHHLGVPRVVYVLANGERLDQWNAYAKRSHAEAAIIEDLKSSIAFKKVWLTNLQHEIALEEEVLKRMEKRLSKN